MVSTLLAIAAMGGAAATAATAASGDASALASAVPHGLTIALAHVPTASHAYQVLSQHLAQLGQSLRGSPAAHTGTLPRGIGRGK